MSVERLQGANVLVTGGSSETGPFICRAFADAGANVATTYFSNEQGAAETAEYVRQHGGQAHVFHLDLLSQPSIDELINAVRSLWDRLDVLVLCCGSKGLRPFRPLSRQQLDTAIDGNLKGNFMLAKELGYHMKQTGGLGKIVMLSAMSAENPSHSAYGIAKAAQNQAALFLAYELAPQVTVNSIVPIGINQDPDAEHPGPDDAPLGRKVHAREIGRMCVTLCDPVFDSVTGEMIRMDSGRHLTPAFPSELRPA
ncbi:MAG: SDR family oxidoreductase [Phycisphaeraceae bacterium]